MYEEQTDGGAGGGGGAAGTPAADASGTPAAAPAVDAKQLQQEVERLRAQVSEKDEAVRYWHGEAKKAPAKADNPEVPQPDDDPDMLDLIGNKGGGKKLTEYLTKKGFVSGADVDARVEARASQMLRESKLIETYPDLNDKQSPFFKATAVEYGNLLNQGVPKPLAMEQAAKLARLAELEAGDSGQGTDARGHGTDARKTEAERVRRVKAQSGDRGRRAAPEADEDQPMTALQKEIADKMGISHEAYAKRAKEGVQLKGGGAA